MNEPIPSRGVRLPASAPAPALVLVLVLIVLSAFVSPAGAETADDGTADEWVASFHLEEIAVEGQRHADAELIVAESLLSAGEVYGEEALRAAVDRVRRLPYVRDASFALRKGSRRGLYELVITIEETRRFFFGANLRFLHYDDFDVAPEDPLDEDSDLAVLAGARFFVGRHGTTFLALRDTEVQVGYTRNQLFGRPASLRVGYAEGLDACCDSRVFGSAVDPTFARWTREESRAVSLGVTLPLDVDAGVSLELEHRASRRGDRSTSSGFLPSPSADLRLRDLDEDRASVSWFRDTTDDSVFARRGLRLVGSLSYERLSADAFEARIFEPFPGRGLLRLETDLAFDSRSLRAGLLHSRWWSPGERNTVWGTVSLAVATSDVDGLPLTVPPGTGGRVPDEPFRAVATSYESVEFAAGAGHRIRLGSPGGVGRELFWETTFLYARDEASTDLVPGVLEHRALETGIVWRTSWGLFRFGVRYLAVTEGP